VAVYVSREYLWSRRYRTVLDAPGHGYLLEAFTQSGTYLISWFIDTFAPSLLADSPSGEAQVAREETLEKRAAAIAPGSDGLVALPYWNGAQTPYWDGDARGAVIGWSGVHTGAHLYRALMEGVAFEIRLQTDGVEADTGFGITHFLTTGGGSRSATWSQLIADVTGRRLEICAESETTALGAAMLASCAVGVHPDLPTAAQRMARTERTFTPDEDSARAYESLYQRYVSIYPTLRELFQS
jgi:xylulokinase